MQFDDIILDPAGFPMVKVGVLYIHWLPVTKIQIEYFLCSITDTSYDESWYDLLLDQNPRISPGDARAENYHKLFATGVILRDMKRYITWCGRGFDLPNEDEWKKVFDVLSNQSSIESDFEQLVAHAKGERAQLLIRKLNQIVTGNRKLADQMFMRNGVMEHVHTGAGSYGLMGQAAPGLVGNLSSPSLERALVTRNENARLKHIGFRLVKRG
jgi:hypothetical protein